LEAPERILVAGSLLQPLSTIRLPQRIVKSTAPAATLDMKSAITRRAQLAGNGKLSDYYLNRASLEPVGTNPGAGAQDSHPLCTPAAMQASRRRITRQVPID